MKKPLLFGIILTACVVIVTFVFAQFYPEGMISYWKFDEGEGTTASDSVDANDGTLLPSLTGPTWTTGLIGNALSFDGLNDYVKVPDHASLDFGPGQDFSLEAWIKAEANQARWQGTILAKLNAPNNPAESTKRDYGYSLMVRGVQDGDRVGKIGIWLGDGDGTDGSFQLYSVNTYDDNTWHHVVATMDRDDLAVLYIDGLEVNHDDISYLSAVDESNYENLEIGREGVYDEYWFKGLIDEVAIYDRALTPEEIQQHYQDGLHGLGYDVECVPPPLDLVSWWPGDENAEDIWDTNHGTFQNDATYPTGRVDQAFSFDGVDAYVEIPHAIEALNAITMDAWVYLPSLPWTDAEVMSKWDQIGNGVIHFEIAPNGKVRMCLRWGTGLYEYIVEFYSTESLPINEWVHVAETWDGSEAKIYFNGVEKGSKFGGGTIRHNEDMKYWIGSAYGTMRFFNGLIDEVEIFDRALSLAEIQDIFAAGSAGKCKVAPNLPPVTNAGLDQVVECINSTGTLVILDGSDSWDPDGDQLTYTWTGLFPEGSGTETGVNPMVTLPLGTSTITLVVNDGLDDSAQDTVDITITVGVDGFLPPLAMLVPADEEAPLPRKAFKQGRTLPLKLQLSCGITSLSGTDVAPPEIVGIVREGNAINLEMIDMDAGEANDSGSLFRFSDPIWVYNLSTRDLSAGTYVITIEMPDGRLFSGTFMLR